MILFLSLICIALLLCGIALAWVTERMEVDES
jgi:hypothetical protein